MSSNNVKTALVTGAARRIGAECARRLHQRGLNLILNYRNSAETAAELAHSLNQQRPGSVSILQADLSREEDIERMAAEVMARDGGIDVLVNNASAFFATPVGSVTPQDWNTLMDANLKGPFFLCQALIDPLRENQGCIVNLVDIHARQPLKDHTVYCIAKAGMAMLTRSLARELGPQIRVNGVSPGSILWPEQPMDIQVRKNILARTALKRRGEPADIAAAVAFLALDSPYITGEILTVDGGRSLNM